MNATTERFRMLNAEIGKIILPIGAIATFTILDCPKEEIEVLAESLDLQVALGSGNTFLRVEYNANVTINVWGK
jgi:hypothetical protein